MAGELANEKKIRIGSNWIEVIVGPSVEISHQGFAINQLVQRFHPKKIEMGWIGDNQAYKLTLYNGIVAIYEDLGTRLELR